MFIQFSGTIIFYLVRDYGSMDSVRSEFHNMDDDAVSRQCTVDCGNFEAIFSVQKSRPRHPLTVRSVKVASNTVLSTRPFADLCQIKGGASNLLALLSGVWCGQDGGSADKGV